MEPQRFVRKNNCVFNVFLMEAIKIEQCHEQFSIEYLITGTDDWSILGFFDTYEEANRVLETMTGCQAIDK